MQHRSFPRAIRGNILASVPRALLNHPVMAATDDPATIVKQLHNEVAGFVSRHESRVSDIDERINNLTSALDSVNGRVSGSLPAPGNGIAPEPEYTTAFASYTRRGDGIDILKSANAAGTRATVHAALSVGSNTDGGFLAPIEWDRKLHERQRAGSPMRRLATVQATSVGAFTSLWNNDLWGSGWVGEIAARPQTTTALLSPIPFAAGEIYANAAATSRLLDDSFVNVDTWLTESLEAEFTRQENIAFLSGDGVNKPTGLLTHATGAINAAVHPGGPIAVTTAAIGYDGLVDFLYSLSAPYRNNSSWLMSSLTAANIAKLKDTTGNPIWREGLMVGQPATLLGRPVEIDEGMPAPTTTNIAIAFGDFRAGYLINDRFGTRVLRDPYSNKPYIHFYATKRVGAGLLDPFAIRFLKVA